MLNLIRNLIGALIVAALVVYLGITFSNHWEEMVLVSSSSNVLLLLAHLLLMFGFFAFMFVSWRSVIKAVGIGAAPKAILMSMYVPNLGKYIPGKIWAVAGRIMLLSEMARTTKKDALAATTIYYIYEVAGASIFVFIWLSLWSWGGVDSRLLLAFAVPFILFGVFPRQILNLGARLTEVFLKRDYSTKKLEFGLLQFILFFFQWFMYAVSGVLLVAALAPIEVAHYPVVASIFVTAWLIGFISFLTPGGIGVREGALIFMLAYLIDENIAVLAALMARLSWTLVEMLSVVFVILYNRFGNHSNCIASA